MTKDHTTVHGTCATRGVAGATARARADELRDASSLPSRMAAALFGIETEERRWRLEARARDRVGRKLANLPDDWGVVHDLPLGPTAELDHLVVGPAGVFALDAVYATCPPAVDGDTVHLGRRVFDLDDVRESAHRVRSGLLGALGWNLPVTPVVVVAGASPDVVVRPSGVVLLTAVGVRLWLARHPRRLLTTGQVARITEAVRSPATWDVPMGPLPIPDGRPLDDRSPSDDGDGPSGWSTSHTA